MGKSIRAARRDQGLCLDCGAPALPSSRYTVAAVQWLLSGDGGSSSSPGTLEFALSQALGRPWKIGDALPTQEHLLRGAFCEACEARNSARRQRQRADREKLPGCRIVRGAWTVPVYRQLRADLGLMIRNARRAAGLSQAEVARRIGRPQSAVSKIEAGDRHLEALDLLEIAAVMDADVGLLALQAGQIWRKSVYRHVKPVVKASSTSGGNEDQDSVAVGPGTMGQPVLWE